MLDRKHILGAVAVFVAVAMLGSVVLAWPSYRQVLAIDHEIADLRDRTQMLGASTAEVELLQARVHEVQRKVEDELKVIASSPDLADLVRRLSLTVDNNTVIDQTFTAGSPFHIELPRMNDDDSKPHARSPLAMPVTVELVGTFESLFAILTSAESMERLIRVGTLQVTCDRNEKNDARSRPIVNATLGLEAVFADR